MLLDFGDASMKDEMHPGFIARGDDELVEHEGATWLRVRSRAVTASFTWPAFANETPDSSVYVETRIRGVTARAVTLSIDGKVIGTETLVRASPRVVLARPPAP